MADRIQLRRDIASSWTAVNPILADGELGYEKDTGKFKLGNGTTAWNSLAYYNIGGTHNSLTGLQGGTTNDYQHLTTDQLAVVNSTSGTNTGDETATTIKTKLGITTLSGSNTGDQDLSGLLPKAGGAMTGAIQRVAEKVVAMAANDIDLSLGNVFTKTITGNTTFTISNGLANPAVNEFILKLTNAGAYTITWFTGVKWINGSAPTLTASGTDYIGFVSSDGLTTVNQIGIAKNVS